MPSLVKVCHLESRLRMRFAPRSSGQITFAFLIALTLGRVWISTNPHTANIAGTL